ncbi:glycosyltransferase [Macrococcoides canis]|uniref:glycosyltransferase n=1 Tax=Macrococcoides canis TaxID=1855823 RepID=UPI00165D7C07|nr:glycosyltransferase [Macrococcus canis]QNR07504.1 glycosyltransferase [Macrococcus canis]
MKILHVITSLSTGGAERALSKIVNHQKNNEIEYTILTLFNIKQTYEINKNVKVISLNRKLSIKHKFLIIMDILKVVHKVNPDIIQFWMKTNIYSFPIKFFFPKITVVSNYRNSYYAEDRLSKTLTKIFSSFSKGNIFVSNLAMQERIENKYKLNNPIVIGNGFDINQLKKYRLEDKPITFGYIGRYHPVKNQKLLIDAINLLDGEENNLNFIIAGRDLSPDKFDYVTKNINIKWLGEISDVKNFYMNIDILILTSRSEGFPNVIGEAMSFGIPVIATNAGASWDIIGKSGFRIKNSEELVKIIKFLCKNKYIIEQKSEIAHAIISNQYSLSSIVSQYEEYYKYIKER